MHTLCYLSRIPVVVAAVFLCGAQAQVSPIGNLAISSIFSKTPVSGTISLAVAPPGPNTASVWLELNGHPLTDAGSPVPPLSGAPWSVSWNTANVWDGVHVLQAIARDANDRIVAASLPVSLVVSNVNSTVTLVSPDPGSTQRGTIEWKVSIQRPSTDGVQYAFTFFADGAQVGDPIYPDTGVASIPLDTTKLSSGTHELMCGIYIDQQPLGFYAGMSQVTIHVDNGKLPLELRSNYASLHLAPNETKTLSARIRYTEGSESGVSPSFSSSDSTIAKVDSNGIVTAVSPGMALINVSSGSLSRSVSVTVHASSEFLHFSKGGSIQRQYNPDQSMFLRTLFFLDGSDLLTTPELAGALKDAAVNALTSAIYLNPADGAAKDFSTWRRDEDSFIGQLNTAASAADLQLFFTGDDFLRTPEELLDSTTGPDAAARIHYAIQRANDTGRSVAIDMVDETDYLWGDTPEPKDGRWLSGTPPVPDSSIARFIDEVHSAPVKPLVGWPVSGLASPAAVQNWELNPKYSDFATIFWTGINRPGYPEGATLQQEYADINSVLDTRLPLLAHRNIPRILLIGASGPFYDKMVPGSQYVPGGDVLRQSGTPARSIQAEIMLAVSKGMAGVRLYGYNSSQRTQERGALPIGTTELETGIDPFKSGVLQWKAMSLAFNLVKTLEPFLLQPDTHALDLGPQILTGAKEGPLGEVFLATNFSEQPQSAAIDLRPYLSLNTKVTRYVLTFRSVQQTTIAGSADTVALEPGSTALYVLERHRIIRTPPRKS